MLRPTLQSTLHLCNNQDVIIDVNACKTRCGKYFTKLVVEITRTRYMTSINAFKKHQSADKLCDEDRIALNKIGLVYYGTR